jgi:cysteinyl-tRNA synthetase
LTDEGLEASKAAVMHLAELAERLDSPMPGSGTPAMATAVAELDQGIREALFDDLNSPRALAAVFNFVRAANADLDRKGGDASAISQARTGLQFVETTLGIVPAKRPMGVFQGTGTFAALGRVETPVETELRLWVEGRLAQRAAARAARDFAQADAIRDELASKGVQIKDSGVGTTWKKVS